MPRGGPKDVPSLSDAPPPHRCRLPFIIPDRPSQTWASATRPCRLAACSPLRRRACVAVPFRCLSLVVGELMFGRRSPLPASSCSLPHAPTHSCPRDRPLKPSLLPLPHYPSAADVGAQVKLLFMLNAIELCAGGFKDEMHAVGHGQEGQGSRPRPARARQGPFQDQERADRLSRCQRCKFVHR